MIKNNKNSTSLDIYFNEIESGTGLYYFLRFLRCIFSPEADLFHSILKLSYPLN
ncbi:MAG: hypothetical protein GW938_17665 [Leptospira sp.]|nr:hypothetical protein [Leptospira sp.]